MKYIGKGFIVGVPARDLTEEEVKIHGKGKLLSSGLYKEDKKIIVKSDEKSEEVLNGERY